MGFGDWMTQTIKGLMSLLSFDKDFIANNKVKLILYEACKSKEMTSKDGNIEKRQEANELYGLIGCLLI